MSAPASNRTLGELADKHGRTDELDDLPTVPGVEEYDPEATVALDVDDTEIDAMADEYGRTDRLNDPAPTFESVCEDTDTDGNSTCLTLQSCPSCPVKFDTERDLRLHLELHDPDHYQLAPLGEGRKRSTEEIFADSERPPALKEPKPLRWKRGDDE
jgi:hypothetical protein